MATVVDIKNELQNVLYPGFTKSIMDFGFVKDIELNNDECIVHLEITSSAAEVEAKLNEDIKTVLGKIGLKTVHIQLKNPKHQNNKATQ